MPHVLLLPVGSHGDVHPFVGIGRRLVERGHRVTMITAEPFRDVAERSGFEFVGTLSAAEYDAMMHDPDLWHPRRGMQVVFGRDLLRRYLPIAFEAIRAHREPGRTVAVGGSLGIPARLAQEALGLPLATVHLQPMACCSAGDPSVMADGTDLTWLPRPLVRLAYRFANWWILDPLLAPTVNEFRRTLDLPPVRRILTEWSPSPQRVIGLFPDWFGPIPDGGPAFRHAGFAFFDDAEGRRTPDPLAAFLAQGPPPVVFSFGSAMRHGRPYFDAAVEACRRTGMRGVLLGRAGDQIPPDLPPHVLHADYAPFSEVFPRAACVVHHGGVGTSAQALRAGVPQLVMPLAFDQPDNAARMRRLGVSRTLFPKRFTGPAVAKVLQSIASDAAMRESARRIATRLQDVDGAANACRLIEELAESHADST
jgi:UDP:flavonoid glycosyltransferase YjiC (YdhE family)